MFSFRTRALALVVGLLFVLSAFHSAAVIRDGGIDPANLGKGEWIYSMKDATNKLGGHISSVTSEATLFQYYKSIGVRYVIIKMATGSTNYGGCYASTNQIVPQVITNAHNNGVWVFGYTRSYGSDLAGESAIADYNFNAGADGFVFDAEAEWEQNQPWIQTNGPALAWQLCSMVRSNWPNKFLAHAPFPIIYLHASFPYKEFGYWCDAVMPQIYHFSTAPYAAGIQGSPSACINWSDVNWRTWQDSLVGLSTNINGQTIYWTNAIKPIIPLQDVYGTAGTAITRCNSSVSAQPANDVLEFIDYSQADPSCQTVGGYKGANFWRADLHDSTQFGYIRDGTAGDFSNVVNNIVIDDANANRVGAWTKVLVFSATTNTTTFTGDGTGIDNNPFGTNYWTAAQGNGSAYMEYTPTVLTAGDYNVYEWHPTRTNASATVPVSIKYDGGTNSVVINQQTNGGTWSFIAKLPFAVGTDSYVRISDGFSESTAVVLVDGLKMVFVPPVAVPATPTGLSAAAFSSSQINLSWTDTATNETGFVVYRSTTNGGPFTTVALVGRSVTSFSDPGLSAGTTYYYVVRGTNYLGLSANSSQGSATTLGGVPTAPSITNQPQNLTVNVGSSASFSVTATGSSPLSYQWRFNTTNIAGATTSTYTRTNVQTADAGNYSVIITNAVGTATSSNAILVVNIIAPSVTGQPQNQSAIAGQTVVFDVVATGSAPLNYQWRFGATPLVGATSSSLTLTNVSAGDAGNYSVLVTNAAGTAVSSNAMLTVNPVFKASGWTKLWSLGGGSQPYLAASGHTERGVAYNPISNRVLLISRASGTRVVVLNGDTGAYLHDLLLDTNLITGGTLSLSMLGVADDGTVYAGNLTIAGNTTPYRLYRWANDNSNTVATLAYSADPSPGNSQRWGDTLDVRGAGTNTQVIIASRSGTNVSVLSTATGTNFTSTAISVPGVESGAFGLGLTFGLNNTFWGKAITLPLRQVSFDLSTGTGSVLRSHPTNAFAGTVSPIGVNGTLNLLVGLNLSNPDTLQLFDLTLDNSTPSLLATTNFATANVNSFYCGAVDFVGQRVYALDSNNGLLAMQLTQAPTAPSITAQPQNQTVSQGSNVTFSVTATGTAPFSYQWLFNGTNLPSATLSSLTRANVQPSDAGNYSVVVTNAGGSVNSSNAILTVNLPPQFQSATVGNDGRLHLLFTGNSGASYAIERSTNLIQWDTVTNFVCTNGVIEVIDDGATNLVNAFYRARQ